LRDIGRRPIAVRVGHAFLYQNGVSRQSTRAASVSLNRLLASRMRHAKLALFVMVLLAMAGAAQAENLGSASGLPVPRFVSLKADKVNMHIGPAKTYDVKWLYQRAGLPVEITAESENWRRIRDADGAEGWVYHSLLAGKRTGMVTTKVPSELVPIYDKADVEAGVAAKLERGVIGTVKRCSDNWCYFTGKGFEGWIQEVRLWGVYPSEKVD
jgi:SH3-like domain-containing protein